MIREKSASLYANIKAQCSTLRTYYIIRVFSFRTDNTRATRQRTATVEDNYSRLSLSRIPRDSLKFFEISELRHIRFAEMGTKYLEQLHLTTICVPGLSKLKIYWKYCGKEEKLLLRSNFSSFPQYFFTCC